MKLPRKPSRRMCPKLVAGRFMLRVTWCNSEAVQALDSLLRRFGRYRVYFRELFFHQGDFQAQQFVVTFRLHHPHAENVLLRRWTGPRNTPAAKPRAKPKRPAIAMREVSMRVTGFDRI